MKTKYINFLKILKKINSSDYIYLGVILLFFIIVIILFLYSTKFIVRNVNKIFSIETEGGAEALNMANYSLVAKRLNLQATTTPNDAVLPTEPTPITSPTPTVLPTPTTVNNP